MLSIIIPALNEEKFLSRLLRSIKDQTFKDYEIIVADAGSKDKTVDIARNFGCRIVKGGLPAKGRNEGAKISQGKLLLFLDADTKLPSKNFFKKILAEFRLRNLDIASCRLLPLEKSKVFKRKSLTNAFELVNYLMTSFEKIAPFGVGSMILVKKDLHEKLGGFDEKVRFGEDTLYIRKGAKIGRFGIFKSTKIYWSVRRFEKEKWIKPVFLYVVGWFLIGLNEKSLDIFKKEGFFEYKFGHYGEPELTKKNQLDLKKLKKILETKIF